MNEEAITYFLEKFSELKQDNSLDQCTLTFTTNSGETKKISHTQPIVITLNRATRTIVFRHSSETEDSFSDSEGALDYEFIRGMSLETTKLKKGEF